MTITIPGREQVDVNLADFAWESDEVFQKAANFVEVIVIHRLV